jgi:hypothetical protein
VTFRFGFCERRQKHAGQNRNDRNDDEQLDESERELSTGEWRGSDHTEIVIGS